MPNTQDCPLCGHPEVPLESIMHRDFGFCPTCKGIFVARAFLPSREEELAIYGMHDNDVEDLGYRNFVRPLVELISSQQDIHHRGLDFGSGPGPVITKMLTEQGYFMELFDPFFHPDTQVLGKRYDFVVACEVVEHFHYPKESFSLLKHLIAPGGKLYCRTTLIPEHIEFSRWHYKNDNSHVFFYHTETIAWIARNIINSQYNIVDRNIVYFTRTC
jgi:hypothetical protein